MNELVKECLDLDDWKHSWHNKFDNLEDFLKARDIIKDKLKERANELKLLTEGLDKIDCIIANEREMIESSG